MKLLVTFLVLFVCSVKAQNPYLTLDYDSLVICDFGNLVETEGNVTQIGSRYLLKSKPQKRVALGLVEAKEFSNRIGLKSSYGQSAAACFVPHFAALYYKGGVGIASVEICVDCNQLYTSHNIKSLVFDSDKNEYGMSKEFRKYLKGLQTKYNFSHKPDGTTGKD